MGKKASNKRPKVHGPLVFLLAFAAGLPTTVGGQPRMDNPARPLATNAGRVVNLVEVRRIRDDGSRIIFRMPHDLALGPDGSLYFADHADAPALYRFGAKGELLFKITKRGQGPGEWQHTAGYLVAPDRIRLLAWVPPKIMDFSPDGRYLREARVEEDTHGLWFLRQAGGRIYGIRDELFGSKTFNTSRSSPAFRVPQSVYEISSDFKSWKKLAEFPVRMILRRGSGFRLDPIHAALSGTTLYVVHTAEYRVTAFDLAAGQAKYILTRAYDRVRAKPEKPDRADPETRGVEYPEDPYVWDIDRIHAAAGKLLVFTSAMKPDGDDCQVDVFDAEGRYVDSVVWRYPAGGRNHRAVARWSVLADDGTFIIPEQEEDGLVSIGVYVVPDPGLFPGQAFPRRTP